MDTVLLFELYQYEQTQLLSVIDIQRTLNEPKCIIEYDTSSMPPISPSKHEATMLEKCALFDSILKPWLICYDLQYKLGLKNSPLPKILEKISDQLDLLPYSVRNEAGESRILPCLVQITKHARVEPPTNVYMVPDFSRIVLVKVDPHVLGKATVLIQKPLFSMTIEYLPDINAIHFVETTYLFAKGNARPVYSGFNILKTVEKEWECRIIFSSSRLFDRAKEWISDSQMDIVHTWSRYFI
jgi:hypothetical protein